MFQIKKEMLIFNDGFHQYHIPFHMAEGLQTYINHRIKQGSFLHAVLCNDLMGACGRADDQNLANLPAYAAFLWRYAPPECFGSKEKVEKWLKDR